MTIAIVGAGIGGLSAAIALRGFGHQVSIFEKATRFLRVGADVNLTPNAVCGLDGLGVGASLRRAAAAPTHRISRMWDTGEVTSCLEMAEAAVAKYGSPQLTIHRADLLSTLLDQIPKENVAFGKPVRGISQSADRVLLTFNDGTVEQFEAVIGCDGIHSFLRSVLFGAERPQFSGIVAYRTVIETRRVDVPGLEAFTKWWGPNPQTQIVTFPLNRGRETFIFATAPQESWLEESWTTEGNVAELHAIYSDFHEHARALLSACDRVLKTALYERDPLPNWTVDRVTLLGDACHPMMPFMAQGAAMAIEDAVLLGRHLARTSSSSLSIALHEYERSRKVRTARVQLASRENAWLRVGGNPDWVYGYNAWCVPLA